MIIHIYIACNYRVLHELSSVQLSAVNPSPEVSLLTSEGGLSHIGQCLFLMEEDLIHMMRLWRSPSLMACASCICLALCSTPQPTLC